MQAEQHFIPRARDPITAGDVVLAAGNGLCAAQYYNAQFEEVVTNCRHIGGTPEDIRVPAGQFRTGRFR